MYNSYVVAVAGECVQLIDCFLKTILADGFKEIIDAVHLKSFQGILIIRCGENYGTIYIHSFENGK